MTFDEFWSQLAGFEDYGDLLSLVKFSLIAAAVLGIAGGLIGVFVMQRDMAFAVHGISELSFAGAAAALLFGANVVAGSIAGSLVAAILIGMLGAKARDRNSIIGVLMPFGMGLGILFLALYPGRSGNKFGLLTGQIISVDGEQLGLLIVISLVVLGALFVVWRPLTFDSLDPEVAAARGVPSRLLSLGFMVLLGLMVAVAVQIIGALLVMALLVTPAAAAMRVSSSPRMVPVLSMIFGFVAATGGVLLALGGSLPISPYITTISFLIYLVCRVVGARRGRSRQHSVSRASGVQLVTASSRGKS
ncbi:metal ABC transporter permease [Salinibacterium sp. M195]|uniref:metal ABC transporter permease n=1 Tax=Salinibacterium sp. M195 TaxID=2583374 RepID=UPI001C638EA9|nr:metal ABC transporter permease [Salinibacterium sp. M195]QYH34916.1 metal ABC transporter permease [Salinibacterium sp. M195]